MKHIVRLIGLRNTILINSHRQSSNSIIKKTVQQRGRETFHWFMSPWHVSIQHFIERMANECNGCGGRHKTPTDLIVLPLTCWNGDQKCKYLMNTKYYTYYQWGRHASIIRRIVCFQMYFHGRVSTISLRNLTYWFWSVRIYTMTQNTIPYNCSSIFYSCFG